jgi:heparosan-N-sulfate-glucuronate 5-epimerase
VRYLPSRIAAFGLANWNRYCLTGNAAGRDAFLKIANWFATAHHDGRYEHDIPIPQLASPWISCIAQGEAASVLTRAYRLVGDDAYLETARLVLRPMLETEAVGGVASTLPDGSPFVEEYPGSSIRHVLNGCLYAAIGMSDVCRAGDQRDDHVRTFLRALIAGIGANILAWDSEGWSTYDLSTGSARNLNTMTYHRLQIVMLRYLGEVCDEPRLIAAAQRWERTADDPGRRIRALVGKVRYRIAARW